MNALRIPIIDAHMHLWDLTRNPRYRWLEEQKPMWIGDYSALRRDYVVEDYLRDVTAQDVVGCVHLQAQWDHSDPIGETQWLDGLADEHDRPSVFVGFCDLAADDAPEVVEQQRAFSRIRGIRQDINWHPNPLYRFCLEPHLMQNDRWRRGLALLEPAGLSFDLQIYAGHQGDEAYDLVRTFEGTQFILDHGGAPFDFHTDPQGRERWLASLRRLAELPNIVTKLSGFDMYDHRWTVESLGEVVRRVIDIFGPRRCLFASNFPVSSLYASYDRLANAHREILSDLSLDEQKMILHDNAARVYRIGEQVPGL